MKTHKYELRLPKNVPEEIQIDQANRHTYWKDKIDKDMKKSEVVYEPR